MTFIKIDPKSIKKNPNAGQRDYLVEGFKTHTLAFNVLSTVKQEVIDHLEDKFNAKLFQYHTSTLTGTRLEFYLAGEINFEEMSKYLKKKAVKKETIILNTEYSHQHVHSITAEPEYFYQYEDTIIECEHCNANFKRSELIDDSDYDYDNNPIGNDLICPKCHEPDCCELVFESFPPGSVKQVVGGLE